ncbi:MAG: hypothetical protein AB1427_16710 [Thermodesulfobacteriota bacterium]
MPNQFLTEIHEYLTEALAAANRRLNSNDCGDGRIDKNFYAGQIEELQALRQYLTDRFDLTTQQYY